MTPKLGFLGASAADPPDSSFGEHRSTWLTRGLEGCQIAYLVGDGGSSTTQEDVANWIHHVPRPPGQPILYLADATKADEAGRSTDVAPYLAVLGRMWSGTVLMCATVAHDPAHYHLAKVATEPASGSGAALLETYYRVLGNTMTHSFVDPRKQHRVAEALKSSAFVSKLSRHLKADDDEAAMRFVFRSLFKLRQAEDYSLCDRILESTAPLAEKIPPTVLISFLTVTFAVRKKLEKRAAFFERARDSILARHDREKTDRLLIGLG